MANGTSEKRARYEHWLGAAHTNLYWASVRAHDLGDEGAAADCEQLLREITRLTEDSLKGNRRGQLALPLPGRSGVASAGPDRSDPPRIRRIRR